MDGVLSHSAHSNHEIRASSPPHSSGTGAWTLPSILKQGKGGLSNVSVEELSQSLQPIFAGLQQLDPESLLDLDRVESGGVRVRDGYVGYVLATYGASVDAEFSSRNHRNLTHIFCCFTPYSACSVQVRPIHDKISPRHPNVVRYIHLNKVPDQYSMGIFVFPPHAKIPLHDHPGMCVISKIIYGDIQRLSLDLPRHNPPSLNSSSTKSWIPWGHQSFNNPPADGTERLAYKNHVDHLQAPDCTVLYPFEGNLHEFVAGPNGAALLDVLLPPYDMDQNRDCTFYYIRDLSDEEQQRIADAGGDHPEKEGTPCWIVPTGQPEDFHCISGTYRDLGE